MDALFIHLGILEIENNENVLIPDSAYRHMKLVSLLLIFCLVLPEICLAEYGAEAATGGAVPFFAVHPREFQGNMRQELPFLSSQSTESQYYRVLLVITSQSDWTTVRVVQGGVIINAAYEVVEGVHAPELECWYDAHLYLVGMTKKQFDTTLIKIEVTAILYVKDSSDLIFEIQKGDIEYTAVEIYNYSGEEPVLIETVTNDVNIEGDPENGMEFSVNLDEVTAGGPLTPLVYSVPKMVWAFYYPWYYRDQWYTSEVLLDSPLNGPHSSSDPEVIEMHIKQAKSAGIDGFIVSWWGENDYTDENLKIILDIADKYDFKITIYFESLGGDGPRSERELKKMFLSFFRAYNDDNRYYRIEGEPVIFVWAVESHEPTVWEDVITAAEQEGYTAVYIAMAVHPGYLDVFDGLHIYGTVGMDSLPVLYERLSVVCRTYGYLNDEKEYIWAATVCPGYDDRKIPGRAGLYQPRENGKYYEETFEAALKSSPDWLLITSFNEWWENTHIEPSVNYGNTYLEMTSHFSSKFKGEQPEQEQEESRKPEPEQEKELEEPEKEIEKPEQEASIGLFLLLVGFLITYMKRSVQYCRSDRKV